ncbi:MAG: hypothetical protein Q4D98_13135 [Planctomycetia bacterium]|nr:hypothetical protein [Planctomycetia bacterium]
MTEKEKDDLHYVCALVEFLGRKTKNHRSEIVRRLGTAELERQLRLAEVNHCLTFEQVADELIAQYAIPTGTFDTVAECEYTVPNFRDIGNNYQRLVLDVLPPGGGLAETAQTIAEVFTSFLSDAMSNFNSDMFYQSREYFKACYQSGRILE